MVGIVTCNKTTKISKEHRDIGHTHAIYTYMYMGISIVMYLLEEVLFGLKLLHNIMKGGTFVGGCFPTCY